MTDDPKVPKPQSVNPSAPKKGRFLQGVVVGAASIVGIGMLVGDGRYPVRVEYEIAKACIDGAGSFLSRESYLSKQERCLCTLEKTMLEVPYEKYKKSSTEFISAFREFSPTCGGRERP